MPLAEGKEIVAISHDDKVLVLLENIGEGEDGDYDPDDPDDQPLLRFTAYVRMTGNEDEDDGLEFSFYREGIAYGFRDGGTYCTCINANAADGVLVDLAQEIANVLSVGLSAGVWKSVASSLSWLTEHALTPEGMRIPVNELDGALSS